MIFNSLNFALFLSIVFVFYWFVTNKNLKIQNSLLLVSSYFFYACWDWRFLFLLIFSTLLDYYTGIRIEKSTNEKGRKFWFWLSVHRSIAIVVQHNTRRRLLNGNDIVVFFRLRWCCAVLQSKKCTRLCQ